MSRPIIVQILLARPDLAYCLSGFSFGVHEGIQRQLIDPFGARSEMDVHFREAPFGCEIDADY
jgi:hypothetical protein